MISELHIGEFMVASGLFAGVLCRKNDGHLIHVTGPSFDLVAGWAQQGVPLRSLARASTAISSAITRSGPPPAGADRSVEADARRVR